MGTWLSAAFALLHRAVLTATLAFAASLTMAPVLIVCIRVAVWMAIGWTIWELGTWLPNLPAWTIELSRKVTSGELNPFNP